MSGVYKKIAAVQAAIAKEGMAKGQKNEQQGYAFRGIDDVYNMLASKLAENQLCVFPTVLERTEQIGKTAKGAPLFRVVVKVQYTLVDAEDGSEHSTIVYGEAMDTSDKATNKAMSGAYKYFAIQTLCIPTVGDNDADATTHEPTGFGHSDLGPAPMGKDFVADPVAKPMSQYAFNKTTHWADSIQSMEQCQTIGELEQWHRDSEEAVAEWPRNSRLSLQEAYEARVKDFEDFIPNEKDAFAL